MFTRILYTTDFSDVSKKALAYIKQLKEAGTKEVIVLHVIDERQIEAVVLYGRGNSCVFIDKMEQEARRELAAIEKELRDYGFVVNSIVTAGIPLREILSVEESEKVSLVVIGSHGKTNLKEMLIGSVSEKVIRRSKSPVLVIKR
jgi:nucleotide-binding universal stress UspA family protein